jgi:RNA polymerase ECF family sigma factor
MNAKQRLDRLKNYETDVKMLNNELIALKSSVLKGQVLSHDPIRTKRGNKTEELNVSIIDKSDQIYRKLEQLLDERTETVKAIERLEEPLEKLVLRYFYIHGYSRERTARTLGRSGSTISRIKSSAIRNLEAILTPTDK